MLEALEEGALLGRQLQGIKGGAIVGTRLTPRVERGTDVVDTVALVVREVSRSYCGSSRNRTPRRVDLVSTSARCSTPATAGQAHADTEGNTPTCRPSETASAEASQEFVRPGAGSACSSRTLIRRLDRPVVPLGRRVAALRAGPTGVPAEAVAAALATPDAAGEVDRRGGESVLVEL